MSDVDLLRRAAALMRERAECGDGPWSVTFIPESAVANQNIIDRWFVMGCRDGDPRNPVGPIATCEWEPAAAHIASWHPAVALAVADWLDDIARWTAFGDNGGARNVSHAVAVARTYLGEQP